MLGMSIENLVYVSSSIARELQKHAPALVALEDYSGGHGPQAVYLPQIGEVAGAAKLWMHQLSIPWKEVAAGTLKKFTTGSGAGKKEVMWLGAYRRWGIDQSTLGTDNNVLDAYCLARLALSIAWADRGEFVPKTDLVIMKAVRTGGSSRVRKTKGRKDKDGE